MISEKKNDCLPFVFQHIFQAITKPMSKRPLSVNYSFFRTFIA